MAIALYPRPPAILPVSTTASLEWETPTFHSHAYHAARWMARHMDTDGWMQDASPARPSPGAICHVPCGPLSFLLPHPHTSRAFSAFVAVRRADGALRPFLWPFRWSTTAGYSSIAHSIQRLFCPHTVEAMAALLQASPVPAKTAAEAFAGLPVLPWIVDDLSQGLQGPQRLVDTGSVHAIARAAWLHAGGAPHSNAASIRLQTAAFHTRATLPWSWDARVHPSLSFSLSWTPRSDSNVARLAQAAGRAAAFLLGRPDIGGERACWLGAPDKGTAGQQRTRTLWQGPLTWDRTSAHHALLERRCAALLSTWNDPKAQDRP